MNSYLLFTDWLWHGCWQHNFPPLALHLQYIFAKKNKILAVFCTAKLKGQGLKTAVVLFDREVGFFAYFFFLKRKIRKKVFPLGISLICPLECIFLFVFWYSLVVFLGVSSSLPLKHFTATTQLFYWFKVQNETNYRCFCYLLAVLRSFFRSINTTEMPLPYQWKVNIFTLYCKWQKRSANSIVASTSLLLERRKMTGFWLLATFCTTVCSVLLLPQFMPFLKTVWRYTWIVVLFEFWLLFNIKSSMQVYIEFSWGLSWGQSNLSLQSSIPQHLSQVGHIWALIMESRETDFHPCWWVQSSRE